VGRGIGSDNGKNELFLRRCREGKLEWVGALASLPALLSETPALEEGSGRKEKKGIR